MDLDHDACYRAVKLRDARFDGRFFTAVKTTGIYCRPICPAARTPQSLRNVTFFPDGGRRAGSGVSSLPALQAGDCTGYAGLARHFDPRYRAGTCVDRIRALDSGNRSSTLAERLGMGERQMRHSSWAASRVPLRSASPRPAASSWRSSSFMRRICP